MVFCWSRLEKLQIPCGRIFDKIWVPSQGVLFTGCYRIQRTTVPPNTKKQVRPDFHPFSSSADFKIFTFGNFVPGHFPAHEGLQQLREKLAAQGEQNKFQKCGCFTHFRSVEILTVVNWLIKSWCDRKQTRKPSVLVRQWQQSQSGSSMKPAPPPTTPIRTKDINTRNNINYTAAKILSIFNPIKNEKLMKPPPAHYRSDDGFWAESIKQWNWTKPLMGKHWVEEVQLWVESEGLQCNRPEARVTIFKKPSTQSRNSVVKKSTNAGLSPQIF